MISKEILDARRAAIATVRKHVAEHPQQARNYNGFGCFYYSATALNPEHTTCFYGCLVPLERRKELAQSGNSISCLFEAGILRTTDPLFNDLQFAVRLQNCHDNIKTSGCGQGPGWIKAANEALDRLEREWVLPYETTGVAG